MGIYIHFNHIILLKNIRNMEALAKGKYERVSEDKYDDFLKALGVNFMLRKAATVSTPVMEVSELGGVWSIKTSTSLKAMELKFKDGEAFDETTPDGREVSALVTLEGNKFISIQTAKKTGQKSTRTIREFTGTECIVTMTIDGLDIVCKQKFKKL